MREQLEAWIEDCRADLYLLLDVDVPWVALGLVGLVTALPAVRTVRAGAIGRELIAVLEATARTQLLAGIGITLGLVLSLG